MLTIAFDTFVLANGLPVILHVDRSSPLVAVDVWYHVGSKDESPGRTGFAHLFEHLMFMGSRNAPYPAFDAIMESWGGHNNGTTSNDRTNYYEIGPRNLLETFLWLEADRLATLPEVITDEELERQRKVVQNERRQSYENRPYGARRAGDPGGDVPAGASVPLADDRIARRSGGGDGRRRARVLRAVLPAVERQPGDRAATSIPAEARDAGREVFRLAAAAAAAGARAAAGGAAAGARHRARADRSRAAAAPAPQLALAGAVRARRRRSGHGRARPGRRQVEPPLQGAGVREAHRAGRVRLPGLADARQPVPGRRDRQAGPRSSTRSRAAVDAEIDRLAAEGPTDAELARARNTHLADFYKGLDHLQTRADLLNHYQHVLGNPDGVGRDVARYEQTTTASVREAFARVVAGRRLDLRVTPEPAAAGTVSGPAVTA